MSLGSGLVSFFIILGTLVFLTAYSWPVLRSNGLSFLTAYKWLPTAKPQPKVGVFGLLAGTSLIAVLALTIAVPLSFTLALFIHEYAPRRLRRPMVYVVDLMAAMPSLIYGLWGFFVLLGPLKGVAKWFGTNLSAIPIFRAEQDYASSIFIAGVVVGIMVAPISTAVMREIFSQVPPENCEAALALGGTRWGMVKTAIIPFSKSGMVGAALLGLGRALGETIAVSLLLSQSFLPKLGVLGLGGGSVAATIATQFGQNVQTDRALMGAGLALFIVTLSVNMAAQKIVKKSRQQ
jgi:phosphate transport system permease protein